MSAKHTYYDKKGYKRTKTPHSNLIHRQRAYKKIYLKYREHYPLPFSEYVVHHRDGNPNNNNVSNLQILTPKDHELLHGMRNGKPIHVDEKVKAEIRKKTPHLADLPKKKKKKYVPYKERDKVRFKNLVGQYTIEKWALIMLILAVAIQLPFWWLPYITQFATVILVLIALLGGIRKIK